MHYESEDEARSLQSLSALADGELDTAGTMLACAQWRGDAAARTSWHVYHLIGDVMRSEELASDARRDVAFVRKVRERLTAEPAVLAPQPVEAYVPAPTGRRSSRNPRWSWMAPAAVAASFMAVASVLLVTRGTEPVGGSTPGLARSLSDSVAAVAPVQAERSLSAAEALSDPQTLVGDGKLVRDARLERYVAAHKQFGGSSALGAPSGFLRAATAQTPDR